MWWTAVFEPIWTVSLLANGATPWERAVEAVDADLVARNPVGLVAASRSDANCPLPLLPYLAAERSVNEFSGDWSEARQRAVTAGSFRLHQVQGTRPALERALAPLGYDVRVVEWFEKAPRGRPNTFNIAVRIGGEETWLARDRQAVIRAANDAKSAHTLLELLQVTREAPAARVYVGGYLRIERSLIVGQVPRVTELYPPDAYTFIGAVLVQRRTLIISARS